MATLTIPIWLMLEYASAALGSSLRDADQHPEEGGRQPHPDHQRTPPRERRLAEREEAEPAEQPRLDHAPAQHGARRRRRHRVRQREPDVQRERAGLDPEAGEQERQGDVPPGRGGDPRRHRRGLQAPRRAHGQEQPRQEQRLPDHSHDDVDPPRAPRIVVAGVDHQRVGGEGHQREGDVERRDVLRHDQPEVPAHREKEAGEEAVPVRVAGVVGAGVHPGRRPEQRGEEEEDLTRQVEPEPGAEQEPGDRPGRHAIREERHRQRGERRPRGERRRGAAQRGGERHQQPQHRRDEGDGEEERDHGP
jgi:hypothetical protein